MKLAHNNRIACQDLILLSHPLVLLIFYTNMLLDCNFWAFHTH